MPKYISDSGLISPLMQGYDPHERMRRCNEFMEVLLPSSPVAAAAATERPPGGAGQTCMAFRLPLAGKGRRLAGEVCMACKPQRIPTRAEKECSPAWTGSGGTGRLPGQFMAVLS